MRINSKDFFKYFKVPLVVVFSIVVYLVFVLTKISPYLDYLILVWGIIIGSFQLVSDTVKSLLKKNFAIDYIALLAIITGLLTQEYLVASVIVLMLSGGDSLEKYAMHQAKKSLTNLSNRIPNEVNLWMNGTIQSKLIISEVKVGSFIAVRKGEVIPLDGKLESENAEIDESSLTGEPYSQGKMKGSLLRSGTVNVGEIIIIEVTKEDKDSSYRKIIQLVKNAQNEKSPFIRLADQYSGYFTIITLILATFAYLISNDPLRVLAVLVIATPCPLILATPIALIGGINSAARENIIIKRIQSLEILAKITTLIFDKTGTITLGHPKLVKINLINTGPDENQSLKIAAAIETSSLHPLAKTIVDEAKRRDLVLPYAIEIQEIVGKGMRGKIENNIYTISKSGSSAVTLFSNDSAIAEFIFEDEIKDGSINTFQTLHNLGLKLFMFTGDIKERAEKTVANLGVPIEIKAECKPEDKLEGIKLLKEKKEITGMVGDGINDAPALALSDVGMVFSNEEQTAASEAADIVFLSSDIASVLTAINISKRTIYIAKQSIFVGIGLSIIGMVFASFGFVLPVVGAFLQEAIDLSVIINALRTSRK